MTCLDTVQAGSKFWREDPRGRNRDYIEWRRRVLEIEHRLILCVQPACACVLHDGGVGCHVSDTKHQTVAHVDG